MDEIRRSFVNPPASHRAAPLWVWNDLMSEEQIARWGYALETARALGMKLYIYDESSYPSGFGGGHVSALLSDGLAQGMTYAILDLSGDARGKQGASSMPAEGPIAAFSCREAAAGIEILEDISLYPADQWADPADKVFVVSLVRPETTGWLALPLWICCGRRSPGPSWPAPTSSISAASARFLARRFPPCSPMSRTSPPAASAMAARLRSRSATGLPMNLSCSTVTAFCATCRACSGT